MKLHWATLKGGGGSTDKLDSPIVSIVIEEKDKFITIDRQLTKDGSEWTVIETEK